MNRVHIFTDGSCLGNPGPGGCAALLISKDKKLVVTDSYPTDVTNNQMELQAILLGLTALKSPCEVTVITDSELAIGWLVKGNKRKDLTLRFILEAIEEAAKKHKVTYQWVKGHNGVRGNEIVNQKATEAAQAAKKEAIEDGFLEAADAIDTSMPSDRHHPFTAPGKESGIL